MGKERQLLALDTEDDSNGTVTLINFFDGVKHITFYGESSRQDAWEWLAGQAPAMVWACNAEYDLINLCGPWVTKLFTIFYVSAGLMKASYVDADIQVYDTLRHWPMSVAKMGEFLGLVKVWSDGFDVAHCRRDTEIVWKFVNRMLFQYRALGLELRNTLPSMSLQLFSQFNRMEYPRMNNQVVKWFRKGYYGGRVEVYRFGKIAGPVYHYDVNSLYPYVMAERQYPDLYSSIMTQRIDLTQEGMADCEVWLPYCEVPALPMREETEILFPVGTMRGVWCYPELRQVIADGGKIVKVFEAVQFSQTCSPFAEYIRYCYANRQKSDGMSSLLWKLYGNSLYGKFAQHSGLECLYQDQQKTIIGKRPRHVNVIWSAYVTCYARLHLLGLLRQAWPVYYTDTDSLFTPNVMPVSKELGALKQEGVYAHAEFFGNKIYVVDEKYKAKGVKQDAAKDFIRTGRAIFRKPARLRESRKSFLTPNKWYLAEKHFRAEYTKRKRASAGFTHPWEYGAYRKAMGVSAR